MNITLVQCLNLLSIMFGLVALVSVGYIIIAILDRTEKNMDMLLRVSVLLLLTAAYAGGLSFVLAHSVDVQTNHVIEITWK